MALVAKTLWQAADPTAPENVAALSIEYDDVLLRIVSVTITNPTSKAVNWSATSTSNGKTYNGSIPAQTPETVFSINNQQAQNRLNITITANGRVDGVEYDIGLG